VPQVSCAPAIATTVSGPPSARTTRIATLGRDVGLPLARVPLIAVEAGEAWAVSGVPHARQKAESGEF